MKLFAEVPTVDIATSTELGARYMTEPTAICQYYYEGMSIYVAEDGNYYFHPQPHEQLGFYPHGQVALTAELELLDNFYVEQLTILAKHNARIFEQSGMQLVTAVTGDAPYFIVYHADMQAYFLLAGKFDDDLLNHALRLELEQLNPAVNSLATPYKVHLDGFGDVSRLEVPEL